MKSRKLVWIAALCVLSAAVLTISLRTHSTAVLAAQHSVSRASLAQPAAYMSNASLRAAAISNALLSDEAGTAQRVSLNLQRNNGPELPPVEEFTLTPPNPALHITKTTVTVRFPELPAEKLASQIPMMLGTQNVVLQRSADDPRIFSTQVDFDWQKFGKEQEQRKEAASRGRMVPVFQGRRFVRSEKMQFVDPAEIQGALQSHQPIQFSPQILTGGVVHIFPDHELMMTALAVVQDPANTVNPCLPVGQRGTPTGPWTFNTLMDAIACPQGLNGTCTQQTAEAMLNSLLTAWQQQEPVNNNNFTVAPRLGIGTLNPPTNLLGNWPQDGSTGLPSLPNAPVQLNAIVNRIDLGEQNLTQATPGELRFVFGVTASASFTGQQQPCSNQGQQSFNIILEFNVPSSIPALTWANDWNNLRDLNSGGSFSAHYLSDLQALTFQVVAPGACGGSSCLAQIRTNEVILGNAPGDPTADFWEQRQFILGLNGSQPVLNETTISMTPDGSFNFGKPVCGSPMPACSANPNTLVNYVVANEPQILATNGVLPIVTDNWPNSPSGVPFLGGSAFNGPGVPAPAFWLGNSSINPNDDTARIDFSVNTCNGCHGAETATDFQQVVNRQATTPSALSSFLLGCLNTSAPCSATAGNQCPLSTEDLGSNQTCTEPVPDPNHQNFPNTTTSFGDIGRRVAYLQHLLGNDPGAGGLLLPFVDHRIGVH